jgi:hypothetical protein
MMTGNGQMTWESAWVIICQHGGTGITNSIFGTGLWGFGGL